MTPFGAKFVDAAQGANVLKKKLVFLVEKNIKEL